MQLVNDPDLTSLLGELPPSFSLSRGSLFQRLQSPFNVILRQNFSRILFKLLASKNPKDETKNPNPIHTEHSDFKLKRGEECPCTMAAILYK